MPVPRAAARATSRSASRRPAAPSSRRASIAGTISLASSIKAGPSDVLYVMAKSGKATLAVRRIEKPSFPLAFEIGGGDAMMGGQPFEGPVDVVARLSRTGDAIPSKGDAEGTARARQDPVEGRLAHDRLRPAVARRPRAPAGARRRSHARAAG